MTPPTSLLIGEFAVRARLPISTLRYYDKIGLLVPATVDPTTGYRRYTVDQLPTAALIARLRSIGVTPENINQVLAGGSSAASALIAERHRIIGEIVRAQQALRRLDALHPVADLPSYDVELVDLKRQQVAAEPYSSPVAELESGLRRAVARLRSALRRNSHQQSGSWGATFPLELTDHVSGFVFVPVTDPTDDALDTAWLPAAKAVQVLHHGDLAALPHAYHAAFAALDDLGAVAAGPVIEEYPGLDEGTGAGLRAVRLRIPYG